MLPMVGITRLIGFKEKNLNRNDIARVQAYLRKTFANDRIVIEAPRKAGAPTEVKIGDEFVGVVHRDDDEGEISYSLVVSILEEDLPAAAPEAKPTRR
jgi:Protein of unknown function (DUF3126)